jgi:putative endonuclease
MSDVWYVYLLECTGGRLYIGITPDLQARFDKHRRGRGALFTRINAPLRMIAALPCANRSEASRLEAEMKKLSPAHKRFMGSRWVLQMGLPTGAEDCS